jgi:hypothetical protein
MGIYDEVYTILVEECGASDDDERFGGYGARWDFVNSMLNHPGVTEYRFQGALGFGGKFWPGSGDELNPPRVTCYQEDETPKRREMIDKANERLKELFSES